MQVETQARFVEQAVEQSAEQGVAEPVVGNLDWVELELDFESFP